MNRNNNGAASAWLWGAHTAPRRSTLRLVRSVRWLLICLAVGCGGRPRTPVVSDPLDEEAEAGLSPEGPLPELSRVGELAEGDYLFRIDGEQTPARLVRVDPDAFVVSIRRGPERSVPRESTWPMACLERAVEVTDGDLRVRLNRGTQVYVLASTARAARVGLGLVRDLSRVVPSDAIGVGSCGAASPEAGASHVGAAPSGDIACLFGDQDPLDETLGLRVPRGAPLRVLDEDGPWARVEIAGHGATLAGWIDATLVAHGASQGPTEADWIRTARGRERCLFPGRPQLRTPTQSELAASPEPSLPEREIERVVHDGEPGIRDCHRDRLVDVPDLSLRIDLVIHVDGDGLVQRVDVPRGGEVDAELTRCVIDRVRRWRFPPPRAAMQVRRSFDLRP